MHPPLQVRWVQCFRYVQRCCHSFDGPLNNKGSPSKRPFPGGAMHARAGRLTGRKPAPTATLSTGHASKCIPSVFMGLIGMSERGGLRCVAFGRHETGTRLQALAGNEHFLSWNGDRVARFSRSGKRTGAGALNRAPLLADIMAFPPLAATGLVGPASDPALRNRGEQRQHAHDSRHRRNQAPSGRGACGKQVVAPPLHVLPMIPVHIQPMKIPPL